MACRPASKAPPEAWAIVNFTDSLQVWDGFGVNYVETAQTPDYDSFPQDYGGLSLLNEVQRREIIQLVFGPEGLQPSLVKMFLDPHHEPSNDNADPLQMDSAGFDHEKTTRWMRYFVQGGLAASAEQGRELEVITTLYGPPGWMTLQRQHRGRDLDPAMKEELGEYYLSWIRYLQNNAYPIRYLSLHNEGEDYKRWTETGYTDSYDKDYNLYWSPLQVADFLKLLPRLFEIHSVAPVGLTLGETSSWMRLTVNHRKDKESYAGLIGLDEEALSRLALITSHSFWAPTSAGTEFLRLRKFQMGQKQAPTCLDNLHQLEKMQTDFLLGFWQEIYQAKVNAIIPWACVQHHPSWTGGDPNPGTAIEVLGPEKYVVHPAYYYYKLVSRLGQRGMRVVNTYCSHDSVKVIAFAANGTTQPGSFVLINPTDQELSIAIRIVASPTETYYMTRTSPGEQYLALGAVRLIEDEIRYVAPPQSATSFSEQPD
ncbi:MAG: hypothetical protein HC842_00175 [Cytophagales bacterium]|nr:hypothetical protein [Cytophagales bacterium]